MLASLPVFYTGCMVADAGALLPGAAKPRPVVDSWRALGIPVEIREPAPVSRSELHLAHAGAFVQGVLAGELPIGLGDCSLRVASSLPYTSGAMLAAAREARRNGAAAAAPCSEFSQAGFRSARGASTFNGFLVAAQAMKAADEVRRVGILDLDQHYGHGTDDIIRALGLDYVEHYSAGRGWNHPRDVADFLESIPVIMSLMSDCDVILYQAGATPHVDDPLGGWLTTNELAERDLIVFETARTMGVPVAWNIAGGYQHPLRKVLDIHDNTLRACWQAFGLPQTAARVVAERSESSCRS